MCLIWKINVQWEKSAYRTAIFLIFRTTLQLLLVYYIQNPCKWTCSWFFFFFCKWDDFCAIVATLKSIILCLKGWHTFHFNMLSYSIFSVTSHTAGRMLISFLPVWIQNNSTGFDVNTWQWEPDSAVCSFIYQLSPITCWSRASKILLNLKSSRAILVNP